MPRLFSNRKSPLALLVVGAVLMWLLLGTIRFFSIPKNIPVHFHANFLMVINGQKIHFDKPEYMEETGNCYLTSTPLYPRQRAHLHNNDGATIHLHTNGVSWGQFFQSLYYTVSDHALIDDHSIVYANNGTNIVTYFINGANVSSIANTLIHSEDSLLITYGLYTPSELTSLATSIQNHAHTYNTELDPSTCSSTPPETTVEHLKKSFLFYS
jgi:hypothetical protein